MERRILVYPITTEIGVEIYYSLKSEKNVEVFGLTSDPTKAKFLGIPDANVLIQTWTQTPDFLQLNRMLNEFRITHIILAHDQIIYDFRVYQPPQGTKLVYHARQSVEVCSFKHLTYRHLSDYIETPKTIFPNALGGLPGFLKPSRGEGSRGARKIHSLGDLGKSDLDKIESEELLLLEYLPGEEITVDCFTNSERKLVFVAGRIRKTIQNGISTLSENIMDSEIGVIANKINAHLELNGPWFFQLKRRAEGTMVLMEIGLRIAGSSGIRRLEGINLTLASIYNLEFPIVRIGPRTISKKYMRLSYSAVDFGVSFESVFVDYDDTVIVNGKINVSVITFLLHARNDGKEIILLTRHKGDLQASLVTFRLENFFNKIIRVDPMLEKSVYLPKSGLHLLIDDSYSELWPATSLQNIICLHSSALN